EQLWSENRLTAEGRLLPEITATPGAEERRGARTVMAMPIASRRLGAAVSLTWWRCSRMARGTWPASGGPSPFEPKRGRRKAHRPDEVQLCAQAIAGGNVRHRHCRGRLVLRRAPSSHHRRLCGA